MDFKVTRELENKVFSTGVKFAAYGGFGLTTEEEEALIADFGAPVIDLGAIEFKGKFAVGADRRVVVDDAAGEEVSFILNSKKVNVDKSFEVSYSIDAKKVPDTEVKAVLKSKELVAEAKCVLFEAKVKEALGNAIDALKAKRTTFESGAVDFTA